MSVFEKLGQGIRTTFHIKDLTPEQKAEAEKKKVEAQAYKQAISEREKQVWQSAYQQELLKQRQLYAEQQDKLTIARGMSKAQSEVQAMSKPKQTFFGALTSQLGGALPRQQSPLQQMAFGTQRRIVKTKKGYYQQPQQAMGGTWDIPLGRSAGTQTYRKGKQTKPDWVTRELGGVVAPYSAQALEHQLKKHHKHHLKHLGTEKGGVTIAVNGTQITLAPQKKGSKRIRHLKRKLKFVPKQQSQQFRDMVWKL